MGGGKPARINLFTFLTYSLSAMYQRMARPDRGQYRQDGQRRRSSTRWRGDLGEPDPRSRPVRSTAMAMASFERDGISLHYDREGEGDPILLFAPGGMRSANALWENTG